MNLPAAVWAALAVGPFVFGQVAGGATAPAPPAGDVEVQNVWDFVVKGGPVMIPIGLCSLIAFTVIVERLICLRRNQVIPADFFSGLSGRLDNGAADRDGALSYCLERQAPVANVLAAGIKRLGQPTKVVEKYIQEAGEREVYRLHKYTRVLSVIASVAPLLGLLGTIFGMITAFQTVAASGDALGKTELLAKGIYQAMITTAAGLMLAIPVLIAYHWITAKIDALVAEMDRLTMEFMEEHVFGVAVPATLVAQPCAPLSVAAPAESASGNGREDGRETETPRAIASSAGAESSA